MDSLAKQNYLSELRALDWNFDGAGGSDGLDGYHWYPARYVSHVPGILIGYFSEPGELVLDPFCGSGTTLVEGRRQGRRVMGVDTNPVATMMAKAKLTSVDEPSWSSYSNALRRAIESSRLDYGRDGAWLKDFVPNFEEQRAWYHEDTLLELAAIWGAIRSVPGVYTAVAEVTFSAILRFACSQDKHWGWICDNVKPKSLVYRPAVRLFLAKLDLFPASAGRLNAAGLPSDEGWIDVRAGKCADVLRLRREESVDLVVTSPPYFSMTDYIRSQRLTFLWQGWDLDETKHEESGARFKRFRRQARAQYLADMKESLQAISRVLKGGGVCCVVVGESPNREPFLDDFRDAMVESGLQIETRIQRRVATQRSFSPQLKHEEVIIARCIK